jgi:radical SAM-linked protein
MRLRITFAKEGWLVYSSHLDLMRVWERALRRGGVPLAYSAGYNPHPKIQLARALPLGHAGEGELIDVWLDEPVPLEDITQSLLGLLPDGLRIEQIRQVDPAVPAMQTQVVATTYRVIVDWEEPADVIEARIERALAQEEVLQEHRGKRYNVRPLIEALWLDEVTDDTAVLGMRLSARPGATGRPEAVLDMLGMGEVFARYQRTGTILSGESAS